MLKANIMEGYIAVISSVEPKMQDLHMRFHSPKGTMEPSIRTVTRIAFFRSFINKKTALTFAFRQTLKCCLFYDSSISASAGSVFELIESV